MLTNGTKIWYKVSSLKNRVGIVIGWLYDSYYVVESEKGEIQYVFPEYIVKIIN